MNIQKLLVILCITSLLLLIPIAGATYDIVSGIASNNTTFTTSAWYTELHNLTLGTGNGTTYLTASWDAKVNFSKPIYGRFLRDGVAFGAFNLTQSTYASVGSYAIAFNETTGTHYYGWEVYSNYQGLIFSRNFSAVFLKNGSYGVASILGSPTGTLDCTGTDEITCTLNPQGTNFRNDTITTQTGQITSLQGNDTTHDSLISSIRSNETTYVTTSNNSYVLINNGSYVLTNNGSYVLTNNASYVLTSNTSYVLVSNDSYVLTSNSSYVKTDNTSYVLTSNTTISSPDPQTYIDNVSAFGAGNLTYWRAGYNGQITGATLFRALPAGDINISFWNVTDNAFIGNVSIASGSSGTATFTPFIFYTGYEILIKVESATTIERIGIVINKIRT